MANIQNHHVFTQWSKCNTIIWANYVDRLAVELLQHLAACMNFVVRRLIFSFISLKAMLLLLSRASVRLHIPHHSTILMKHIVTALVSFEVFLRGKGQGKFQIEHLRCKLVGCVCHWIHTAIDFIFSEAAHLTGGSISEDYGETWNYHSELIFRHASVLLRGGLFPLKSG